MIVSCTKFVNMRKIVIIGGGLSGTLLSIHLLRVHANRPLNMTVVDSYPPEMLGAAYSTEKDFHLLNVPADKMSAFPDISDDFVHWLSASGYPYQRKSFVPRNIYKRYIQDILAKELGRKDEKVRYAFIQGTAIGVEPVDRALVLRSGEKVPFDKLILAVGNYKAASLPLADKGYMCHPAYFGSAWDNGLFDHLEENGKVLIIGTGLTMVDTVLTLRQKKHKGSITALSTHGFTPRSHGQSSPYPISPQATDGIGTCLDALKFVNEHLKNARRQGIGWHSVIDAIRPFTQQIWQNLPTQEKKKFMEHLRHIWGVARHRMPQECAAGLHELLSTGQLSILAGRIKGIRYGPQQRFSVDYQERSSKRPLNLEADTIVNCMGPESNYEKLEDPLIDNLLQLGLMRTDPLRLGIDCTPEGAILEKDGVPSRCLYAIGPPVRGILWEITSVPEIRTAALQLAKLVSQAEDQFVH